MKFLKFKLNLRKPLTLITTAAFLLSTPVFAKPNNYNQQSKKRFRTLNDVKAAYPNARIKTVSVDQFNEIKNYYAQNEKPSSNDDVTPSTHYPNNSDAEDINNDKAYQTSPSAEKEKFCNVYRKHLYFGYSEDENYKIKLNPVRKESATPSYNFEGTNGKGIDKEFLVIVAVIGVVVVAALVIYAGSYLYNSFKNNMHCEAWEEMGYRYSNISDNNDTQVRHGILNGFYYSKGYFLPNGVMGFTAEAGNFQMDIKLNQTSQTKNYGGPYLLLGPTFTFPISTFNKGHYSIELLGGTTSEKDIGFMSTIRMSIGFKLGNKVSLSAGIGAAYVNIKGLKGFLGHHDDLNFLTGIKTTVRF